VSASEKLRALDEAIHPAPWIAVPNTPVVFPEVQVGDFVKLATVRNALPQLVAVVEAAELVDECADPLEEDGYKYLSTRAVLADLEKALP